MRRAPTLSFLLLLAAVPATGADFFGPTPYLSRADTPPDFATGEACIEDFEDGIADARLSFPQPGSSILASAVDRSLLRANRQEATIHCYD